MGERIVKRCLSWPLNKIKEIQQSHETVNYLINSDDFFETVTYQIKQISDIERLISKVATGKASPREVVYLKNSLQAIIPIKEAAEKSTNASVKQIGKSLNNCSELIAKISETIFDDAPVNINKGNAIGNEV